MDPAQSLPTGNQVTSAVMVDFGLMRSVTAHPPTRPAVSHGYCGPEVYSGLYSTASDMYAFAAVIYWLLTGETPPVAASAEQLSACAGRLRDIGMPENAVAHIVGELDADAARRPIGARALLNHVRGGMTTTQVYPPLQPTQYRSPKPSPSKRKRRLIAAVVLGLLLLGAAVGVGLMRSKGQDETRAAPPASTTYVDPATSSSSSSTSSSSTSTTSITPTTTTASTLVAGATQVSGTIRLEEQKAAQGSSAVYVAPTAANGRQYDRAIRIGYDSCDTSNTVVEYDLGRQAPATFTADLALADSNLSGSAAKVAIFLDGRQVFNQKVTFGNTMPLRFDVSGVLRIRLEVMSAGAPYSGCGQKVVLGDPTVTSQ